jgi:hypothetical protein
LGVALKDFFGEEPFSLVHHQFFETLGTPPQRKFNYGHNIWEKSVVLKGTSLGTCRKLGEPFKN